MAEIEQTNITIKRRRDSSISLSRKDIYRMQSDFEEKEKREKEHQIANYNAYGNGRYTKEGSKDRLLGKVATLPLNAVSESDIISYYGGYYNKGSRNLVIYTSGKIPEFISKKELLNALGYNIIEDDEIQVQEIINEILTKIGYIDGQDAKIIYEDLPSDVKNNIYYTSAYNIAAENTNKKKR